MGSSRPGKARDKQGVPKGAANLGSGRIDRRQRRDSDLAGLWWAGLDRAGQVGNAHKQTDVPMVAFKTWLVGS